MADKKLNEVTKVTDMAYVPVIMSDGSIGQIAKADLATVVAGELGLSNFKVDKTIAPGSELILPFQSGLMTFKAPYYSSSMAVWIWTTNNTDNVNIHSPRSQSVGKRRKFCFLRIQKQR